MRRLLALLFAFISFSCGPTSASEEFGIKVQSFAARVNTEALRNGDDVRLTLEGCSVDTGCRFVWPGDDSVYVLADTDADLIGEVLSVKVVAERDGSMERFIAVCRAVMHTVDPDLRYRRIPGSRSTDIFVRVLEAVMDGAPITLASRDAEFTAVVDEGRIVFMTRPLS